MAQQRPPLFLLAVNGIAMICALVAGVAVAALAILILIDIIGRSIGHSVQGTDELGGYVLALCGSLGLSWTLINRAHPRIDLGFRLFSPTMRNLLHVLAQGTMFLFSLFMTWHALTEFRATLQFGAVTNTPLQTPLWLPQSLWLMGLVLFTLTALSATLHGVWLMRNDPEEVSGRYGPPTVEEEVGEYVGPAKDT